MGRLDGKVAIVTGAGNGIGKAIAETFAREGARVMLSDVDAQAAEAAATGICEAGGAAAWMPQDVSDEQRWPQVVDRTVELFGGLNVLVNNAGIGEVCDVEDLDTERMRHMFAVNVEGTLFGIKYALAAMNDSGGGSIINISSVGGIVGWPGLAVYCASKAAVRLLTKSVALECTREKYGIRVNSIHPGFVATSSSVAAAQQSTGLPHDEAIGALTAMVPMGRPGTPEEIANGALFLASDEASFITAAELVIDGGMSAT